MDLCPSKSIYSSGFISVHLEQVNFLLAPVNHPLDIFNPA